MAFRRFSNSKDGDDPKGKRPVIGESSRSAAQPEAVPLGHVLKVITSVDKRDEFYLDKEQVVRYIIPKLSPNQQRSLRSRYVPVEIPTYDPIQEEAMWLPVYLDDRGYVLKNKGIMVPYDLQVGDRVRFWWDANVMKIKVEKEGGPFPTLDSSKAEVQMKTINLKGKKN